MKIGFLGFGKVASIFAKGLKENGVDEIIAFDSLWSKEPYSSKISEVAEEIGVELVKSEKELAEKVTLIFSTVTPAASREAMLKIAPFLAEDKIYVDLNSTAPMTKQNNYSYLTSLSFNSYIDGCILGSVDATGIDTPILICGGKAIEISKLMNNYGMRMKVVDGSPGDATAVKMIRSVFMKGIEVLFVETLDAANSYNIEEEVLDTIRDTFEAYSFDGLIDMLVTSHAIHAKRRKGEMQEVIETLEDRNVDAIMSKATKEKLEWSSSLELDSYFDYTKPESYKIVIESLSEKLKKENNLQAVELSK